MFRTLQVSVNGYRVRKIVVLQGNDIVGKIKEQRIKRQEEEKRDLDQHFSKK